MLRLKLSLLVAIFTFAQTSFAMSDDEIAQAFTDYIEYAAATFEADDRISLIEADGTVIDTSDTGVFNTALPETVYVQINDESVGGVVSSTTVAGENGEAITNLAYADANGSHVCGIQNIITEDMDANQRRRSALAAVDGLSKCVQVFVSQKSLELNKRMPAGIISAVGTVIYVAATGAQISSFAYLGSEIYREIKGVYPGQKKVRTGTAVALRNNPGVGSRIVGTAVAANNKVWHNKRFGKGTSLGKRSLAAGIVLGVWILL